jgi:hypothetical protein
MKAIIALPVRSTDYWHEEAIVIHGDAEMRELIGSVGSNRVDRLISILGWESRPEQPGLLLWDAVSDAGEYMGLTPGTCSALTPEQWGLVASGRIEDVFGDFGVSPDGAKPVRAPAWHDISEQWRRSTIRWQEWAAKLLSELGLQPLHGEHGDDSARNIIGNIARKTSGATRTSLSSPWEHK